MADMTRFMRHVLPHAQACLEPLAFQYLRDSAIEFCRRTRAWRFVAKAEAVEGRPIIIPVPEGATLFEVESVFLDRKKLDAVPYSSLDFDRQPGNAYQFAMDANNRAYVVPEQEGTLVVTMFLVPSAETEELPDFLLEDHGKYIGAGALKDLLMLPNQPYSDPNKAGVFAMQFEQHVDTHFMLHVRGKQRAPVRSKPSWL